MLPRIVLIVVLCLGPAGSHAFNVFAEMHRQIVDGNSSDIISQDKSLYPDATTVTTITITDTTTSTTTTTTITTTITINNEPGVAEMAMESLKAAESAVDTFAIALGSVATLAMILAAACLKIKLKVQELRRAHEAYGDCLMDSVAVIIDCAGPQPRDPANAQPTSDDEADVYMDAVSQV